MARTRLLLAAAGVAAALAVTTLPQPALASPGDVDAAFGTAGTVSFPPDAGGALTGSLLAHSSLGTVLAQNATVDSPFGGQLSQVVVRRLDAQGHVDPGFGNAGSTVLDLGQPAFVRDLAVTRDDRTLLLLSVGDGFDAPQQVGLARLLKDGTPDPGFGTGGVVVSPSADGRPPVALLPRPGGAILVGLAENGQGTSDFATQRYDEHGASSGALLTVDLGGYDVLTDLVAGPAGSYYAVGYSAKPSGQSAAAVRVLPDGTPDPSFGVAGIARVSARRRGLTTQGAVASGSSLLLYGAAQSGQDFDGFVARLSAAGQPATGFGNQGLLLLGTPGNLETVTSVAASSPGTVVASVAVQGGADSGLLVRLSARTGVLDTTFGTAGRLALPGWTFAQLLADGNGMLLAGTRYTATGPVEVVQRRLDS